MVWALSPATRCVDARKKHRSLWWLWSRTMGNYKNKNHMKLMVEEDSSWVLGWYPRLMDNRNHHGYTVRTIFHNEYCRPHQEAWLGLSSDNPWHSTSALGFYSGIRHKPNNKVNWFSVLSPACKNLEQWLAHARCCSEDSWPVVHSSAPQVNYTTCLLNECFPTRHCTWGSPMRKNIVRILPSPMFAHHKDLMACPGDGRSFGMITAWL